MPEYYAHIWSLLPPVIAVLLALLTREVYSSLIVGILLGTGIYCVGVDYNSGLIVGSVQLSLQLMVEKFNLYIVLFGTLLGSLVYLITMSGGSKAYGNWSIKHIKGRRSAMLATSFLGAGIFVDDGFNCLTVGTVMRPITDAYKISRAKLAYIVDSTAAPVCIIAPISTWAAAVGSYLKDNASFSSEMSAFISTIPWNFYALLSLVMILLLSLTQLDFGPMKRSESKSQQNESVNEISLSESQPSSTANRGSILDMVLPIFVLIITALGSLLYLGGYWGEDPHYHSFSSALGNTDGGPALVLGVSCALLVSLILYLSRGLMDLKQYMQGIVRGIQSMIPAAIVLTLAWTISGVCSDLLHAPQYLSSVVEDGSQSLSKFLPAAIFIIAGFLSFATGTSWGTFGILIPIIVPLCQGIDTSSQELVIISLSATLAGSVFGDHCSPISDTTILSAAGAGCNHLEHVYTQIPYAVLVATAALIGYIVAGLSYNLLLSLSCAAIFLCLAFWLLSHLRMAKARRAPF